MFGVRWQERRLLIVVIGLAAAGAVSGVLVAFKVTVPWILGAAAVVVAVATVVSGLVQERYKRTVARQDEVTLKLQDGALVLPSGRLPRVSDVTDPLQLGVHPAISLPGSPDTEPPAYVPRDVDDEVREALAGGGFVLLVGDSTAGKSRTAYEAVRATLPDHVLVAPHDRAALPAAIESCVRVQRVVLWLSDLEHYLGPGGLTREQIARITGGSGHRVIVATLRSAEQARLTSPAADPDDAMRAAGRQIREALEQAYAIRLPRIFSRTELERAQAREWDARISSALEHADECGIAEYLASGPELQRLFADAWDVGVNPRGAALVAAAIDCRRAGYTSPLPRTLLAELHTAYLDSRGGHRLQPESMQEAWDWATQPRRATTALLSLVSGAADDGVDVFDYLVDVQQQADGPLAQVATSVIEVMLAHVGNPEDADQIGLTTYRQGRYPLAEQAYRMAYPLHQQTHGNDAPITLTSRNNLALVLDELGRLQESEAEHRAVLEMRRRVLGEEHPDTLTSRSNLAGVLRALGRLQESEAEHRAVLEMRRRVLGEEHPDTLTSRNNLALMLRALGRLQESEAEHRAELEVCRRVLGEEHPSTLISRSNLALVLGERGWLEEAEAEFRAVLEMRRRVLGEEHPSTLTSRNNLAGVLGERGWLEEAEAELRAVLEVCRRVLGEEHPSTLISRSNLAGVLDEQGWLEEAEAEHRAVLEMRRRVLGEEHPSTLISRNNLAGVLHKLGRLEEAEAEHRAVLEVCRRVLGEEHPSTLISRSNLAGVLGERGWLEEAEAELRAVLEVCRRVLGEEHPSTLTSRSNLAGVLGERGWLEEAEAEHRAVLEMRRRVLGEERPETLTGRNNLTTVLRHQELQKETEVRPTQSVEKE
ncbi:tetratricopeptide repeat protein [Nonomuraea rhodomycinica]|uniref:Tetratricopeptide repeat protein n=1 Tax=Nonomuraea rhodomycinica TaxID=1712872 RepID=A0A7Y6IV56_9ACTN|nr:tetratricopeptide repeat protein [Nonomuraea rhodomycinica]NUW44977.1 tetratricopeptide repeat protein [Nonomuraea rhodomycinica]